MNTPENYAKQIKNAKRHIEKREKNCGCQAYQGAVKKGTKGAKRNGMRFR